MRFNIYKHIIILYILLILLSAKAFATNKTVDMKLTYDYLTHNYIAEEVFVSIDEENLENLSMPPVILNSYTLIPAREVFEKTGATVEWKADIKQVIVTTDDDIIIIPINSKNAYVNGKKEEMDTEAKIINNKTMIPLRFVSTTMGYEVNWDSKTRIANITTIEKPILEQSFVGKPICKLISKDGKILAEYPYIRDIGSNVVISEHLGDMVIESTPNQESFIIRLFSEKKLLKIIISLLHCITENLLHLENLTMQRLYLMKTEALSLNQT